MGPKEKGRDVYGSGAPATGGVVSAANFAPRFNSVAEDDDFGKSASQGGATVSFPFFIGALAMLLLPSFD